MRPGLRVIESTDIALRKSCNPLADQYMIVRPENTVYMFWECTPRKVCYACGHADVEQFSIAGSGSTKSFTAKHPTCPKCTLEKMREQSRICPLCTLTIWPNDSIKLYEITEEIEAAIETVASASVGKIMKGIVYRNSTIMGCTDRNCAKRHLRSSRFIGFWNGDDVLITGHDHTPYARSHI